MAAKLPCYIGLFVHFTDYQRKLGRAFAYVLYCYLSEHLQFATNLSCPYQFPPFIPLTFIKRFITITTTAPFMGAASRVSESDRPASAIWAESKSTINAEDSYQEA